MESIESAIIIISLGPMILVGMVNILVLREVLSDHKDVAARIFHFFETVMDILVIFFAACSSLGLDIFIAALWMPLCYSVTNVVHKGYFPLLSISYHSMGRFIYYSTSCITLSRQAKLDGKFAKLEIFNCELKFLVAILNEKKNDFFELRE